MTDAAFAAKLSGMRAFMIWSALAAAFAAMPVMATDLATAGAPASLLPAAPETAAPPSRLAPLAVDSVWAPRFEAAANELEQALRSRDEGQWKPLLGGQWLTATDRDRVHGLLRDSGSPFVHALFSKGGPHRAIFGWAAPQSLNADERAAIEAGQEAEALVCWSAGGNGEGPWPATAAEADNAPQSSYACARIAYSIRGDAPTWRAFIEQRVAA
ncbi:MAG: hypothetical protein Q7T60_07400 [Sphingopyxis sp.]|nr:hypothetical protein [Sphingopyxis sp.]